MMDKKNNVETLKKRANKKWFEAFPHVIAFLFFLGGMVMNLFTNIIHDSIKEINNPVVYHIYIIVISLLFGCFYIGLYYVIRRLYIKPYEKLEKKIESLKEDKV